MRTRDEVLREFLPESEWDDYDPQFVMELMASRIAQQEARIRELEGDAKRLREAGADALWYMIREVVWCNGNKCRELNCASCFGEEMAEPFVQKAIESEHALRAAIDHAMTPEVDRG